jgi:hypothetical protein
MSPSRSIDRRACWKSCQSWASRSTGELTRPDSMLKATSWPTLRSPSITSLAPKYSVAAMPSLLMSCAA